MIAPYVRRPEPPTVCLLTEDGRVVSERGKRITLDLIPDRHRVWASYDTVRSLVTAGHGEALCWLGEEIRWRHRHHDDEWKARPSDVHVIRAAFPADDREALRGLAAWRDWLAAEGACPVSSVGSASWSLLRSQLERELWWDVGQSPPLTHVIGGRQQPARRGRGRFAGPVFQYDLQAAYASTLASLQYGGAWSKLAAPFDPERLSARSERCVFVRARVVVPSWLEYGPLVRRPRKRPTGRMRHMLGLLLGNDYPTGRMQGVWTWEELQVAVEAGCRIERLIEAWVHTSGRWRPFAPWWEAVQRGRDLPDRFGATLAKMTGNALWGQFCIGDGTGSRTIASTVNGRRRERQLPPRPSRRPAVDLAETVAGRIRARLYELLQEAGDELVSAHTDGGWSQREIGAMSPGWRLKAVASRVDVLGPQALRYVDAQTGRERCSLAGVPSGLASETFERLWAEAGDMPVHRVDNRAA